MTLCIVSTFLVLTSRLSMSFCGQSIIVRRNSGNFDFNPFEKTCIWGKHSFGILRPSTYQIWMMPSANYSLLFKIQDGGGGHLENWGNRYFIVIATFVYTYRDYNYTYLQHLTSQIFSPSFSNDIRDKNRHFIIFWCQMWKIVIYFWKNILWFYWALLSNQ